MPTATAISATRTRRARIQAATPAARRREIGHDARPWEEIGGNDVALDQRRVSGLFEERGTAGHAWILQTAELARWSDCFRGIPGIADPASTAEGFLRHCRSIGEPPSMALLARLAGEAQSGR